MTFLIVCLNDVKVFWNILNSDFVKKAKKQNKMINDPKLKSNILCISNKLESYLLARRLIIKLAERERIPKGYGQLTV